jgi:hypothetical protein
MIGGRVEYPIRKIPLRDPQQVGGPVQRTGVATVAGASPSSLEWVIEAAYTQSNLYTFDFGGAD